MQLVWGDLKKLSLNHAGKLRAICNPCELKKKKNDSNVGE
jgi:hypothetical protein